MYKVYELLAGKGIDVSKYEDDDKREIEIVELKGKVHELKLHIFGEKDESTGRWTAMGRKEKVRRLFATLKDMPFSDVNRETFKNTVLLEKVILDQLFIELNATVSDLNKLLEV